MIERAEQNSWIPPEIYGRRKNHEAIEVAMNRRLVADIAWQRCSPLAIASVDAQEICYDRMAHSIASIASNAGLAGRPVRHQRYAPANPMYEIFSSLHSLRRFDYAFWRTPNITIPRGMPRQ
jgi:hypothetical protein